jgi:hypothetical protein
MITLENVTLLAFNWSKINNKKAGIYRFIYEQKFSLKDANSQLIYALENQ